MIFGLSIPLILMTAFGRHAKCRIPGVAFEVVRPTYPQVLPCQGVETGPCPSYAPPPPSTHPPPHGDVSITAPPPSIFSPRQGLAFTCQPADRLLAVNDIQSK